MRRGPALILLLVLALSAAALFVMLDDDDEGSPTAPTTTAPTATTTTATPPPPAPSDVAVASERLCRLTYEQDGPAKLARDLRAADESPEALATAWAQRFRPQIQEPAREGCLRGILAVRR